MKPCGATKCASSPKSSGKNHARGDHAGKAEPERLLTLGDIREIAGVSDETVNRWRESFGLVVVRLGRGTIRVALSDWRAFVEKNKGVGLGSPVGTGWGGTKGRRTRAGLRRHADNGTS
jgi:hypothetical protein